MERQAFEGSTVAEVAMAASAYLDISPKFILRSYGDGDFARPRFFERLGQKHATCKVVL